MNLLMFSCHLLCSFLLFFAVTLSVIVILLAVSFSAFIGPLNWWINFWCLSQRAFICLANYIGISLPLFHSLSVTLLPTNTFAYTIKMKMRENFAYKDRFRLVCIWFIDKNSFVAILCQMSAWRTVINHLILCRFGCHHFDRKATHIHRL